MSPATPNRQYMAVRALSLALGRVMLAANVYVTVTWISLVAWVPRQHASPSAGDRTAEREPSARAASNQQTANYI